MNAENIDSTDAGRELLNQKSQDDLLSSWKEIAVYLKRDVRTVRRWEADQSLPVRRHLHQKGASVYAYRSELDVWWKGEKGKLAVAAAVLEPEGHDAQVPLGLRSAAAQVESELVARTRSVSPQQEPRRRTVWLWMAVLAAIAVAAYWVSTRPRASQARAPRGPGKIMLAVLPFENLTGDPSQEFVSDGLTEELSTQISELQHDRLGVIARTSAMSYKGSTKPVSEIARDLNVDYVLEGSIRRWGARARISAQLIEARSQTHVWAQNFESDQHDILKLQDDMAHAVARSIDAALLAPSDVRSASRGSGAAPRVLDPEVHDFYLKGRYELNLRTRESLSESVKNFEKAVARDPNYAAAYADLANAYNLIGFYGFDPSLDAPAKAKSAALKALQLDSSLSSAHTALAYTQFMWRENWPGAQQEFRRALELDDNDVPAHHWYALYLAAQGQMDESLEQIEYAKKLDPVSSTAYAALAYVEYLARHNDQAVATAQMALRLNSKSMAARAVLGWAYTEQKKYPAAIEELTAAVKLSGGVPVYVCALARATALSGDLRGARKMLSDLQAKLDEPKGMGTALAEVYLSLGDSESALHWLEKTAPGDIQANWLRVDPAFDSLRGNSRFGAVLARVGKAVE